MDSSLSCDKGDISLFLCLDFLSVFDTVDHSLLIQQLETSFGIFTSCLKWIFFHLFNRSSVVSMNNSHSTPFSFIWCLSGFCSRSSFLFLRLELLRIISSLSLQSQLYADDFHIFTSFPKYELSSAISKMSCIGKISFWSDSLFLKLNHSNLDSIYLSEFSRFFESLFSIDFSSNPSLVFFQPFIV